MEFIRRELKRSQQNILFGPPRTHLVKKESGRHLADIGIDEDIGVELKLNLRKKAEMDRLEGQVSGFTREYSCIIVVLCGEVSEEIVEELKYRFKRSYGNVGFGLGLQGPRVEIVRKDEAWIKRGKKKTSYKKTQPSSGQPSFSQPTFNQPSFDSPFDNAPEKRGRKKKG